MHRGAWCTYLRDGGRGVARRVHQLEEHDERDDGDHHEHDAGEQALVRACTVHREVADGAAGERCVLSQSQHQSKLPGVTCR